MGIESSANEAVDNQPGIVWEQTVYKLKKKQVLYEYYDKSRRSSGQVKT